MLQRFIHLLFLICFFSLLTGAKTFLFIGDSITDGNWGSPQGYPCSSEQRNQWDKNHILGHGYVEMIAGELGGENPDSNYYFINRGISGETLFQISSRWDKDVISHKPDVITLLCGTNDIHYWLQSFPESIEKFDFNKFNSTLDSLINYTRQQLPGVSFLIGTPFVAKVGDIGLAADYKLRKEAIDSLSSNIRNLVSNYKNADIGIIDFNRLLTKLLSSKSEANYWIWDGIHPTTPMHYQLAKEWLKNYE